MENQLQAILLPIFIDTKTTDRLVRFRDIRSKKGCWIKAQTVTENRNTHNTSHQNMSKDSYLLLAFTHIKQASHRD